MIMRKANKFRLNRDIYLEADLLESPAFKMLSAKGILVLLRFLQKRTWRKTKRHRRPEFNDDIVAFTYEEANDMGISKSQFHTIIRRLVDVGFIDMEHQGGA
jgi:hypothetical protein